MTDLDELIPLLERISLKQKFYIIRNPWHWSKELVYEVALMIDGELGEGSSECICNLTDEEFYVGGTG